MNEADPKNNWVPECGDRVKLNADGRRANFPVGVDGRRRWTVAAIRYHAGWRQPDVVMTDGEELNAAWLEPASSKGKS